MAINPKSLIPDIKQALATVRAALGASGATPQQQLAEKQAALQEAQAVLEFVAAAVGDPEALQAVMSWALDAPAAETVEAVKAGRVPRAWLDARRANAHPLGCSCDWCEEGRAALQVVR